MSDCIGAPAREWLERYVDGTLPEAEAQKFEEHYFDCPACLGQLQALQAVQEQLRRHPVPIVAVQPKARILTWPRMVTVGAMAAALVIGVITLRMVQSGQPAANQAPTHPAPTVSSPAANQPAPSTSQPEVQIAELADLHLPSYHAPTLRGESEDSLYERGMKQYAAGKCRNAIDTLGQVPPDGPDGVAAQFYAGLCRMHTGDLGGATATLRRVAFAGDSPELESAWYYLAQLALAHSDVNEARRDLRHVVALHGDFEKRARTQLAKLPQSSNQAH